MPRCGSSLRNNERLWLWVPAFAGTTLRAKCSRLAASKNQGLALPSFAVSATEASVVSRRNVKVS